MKIILLWLGLSTCTPQLFAQNDTIYYRFAKQVSKSDSYTTYKVVHPATSNGKHHVSKYGRFNDLLSSEESIFSSRDSSLIIDGKYIEYDNHRDVKYKATYVNGKLNGTATSYFQNSDQIWYVEQYKNNVLDGTLKSYYESGKLKHLEEYREGTYVNGQTFDEEGNEIENSLFTVMPKPSVDITKFLQENLKYPRKDRRKGITGQAIISFIISESGDVLEAEILAAPSEAIGNEALRVVKLMPKWSPGIKDDKKIKTRFTQPINFNLE